MPDTGHPPDPRNAREITRDDRDIARDGRDSSLDRLESKIDALADRMNTAFPSGDVEGHRRFHETQILMLDEKRRLRIAIQEKTISGLVWAMVVGLGFSVWNYIKDHLK